jgi:L-threonylcarbamoyladenylate synthase
VQYDYVVRQLRSGLVGAISTDTVYGLVASASRLYSVKRLYEIKSRVSKPGTIIAASLDQLCELGLDGALLQSAAAMWPNPVSVVIDAGDTLDYLHQGVGSLAVRIPAHDQLRSILSHTGPLMTSSANRPTAPPASSLAEARRYFGRDVDFYWDGLAPGIGYPSAVVRYSGRDLEIIRPPDYAHRDYYSGLARVELFSEPLVQATTSTSRKT